MLKRSVMSIKVWLVMLNMFYVNLVYAGTAKSAGGVAAEIYSSFAQITKLITAGSYLAGLAFSIGAIMKFKQHKDNPTQVPIGTPIALLFIAAALLFLPSVLGVAGQTIFGGGEVSGPSGKVFGTSGN